MALAEQVVAQTKVTDLLLRYWGWGQELNAEEKEELLIALDAENKFMRGPIHQRALERLKEKGVD
jgi:hypothetical protein